MDLPGSYAATHGSPIAWFLPLAVSALVLVAAFRPSAGPSFRRSVRFSLVVAAVLSAGCYVDWGKFRYGSYLNEWDVYHYYVGSKYLDELGYFGLYEATLVADAESIHRYHNPHHRIRDLRTNAFVDVDRVLTRRETIRARFTGARWREFVEDVRYFAQALPEARFSILLEDRGLNGTPPWTFYLRTLLSSPFSIRDPVGRFVLLAVDPLLLAATFVAIRRAYGRNAMLLGMVLLGTHYLLSWGHLKGALVRTDFAACAAMAVCALRLGRPRLAGGLLAWASISRLFPVLLLIGPVAVLLGRFVRTRTWDRQVLEMLGSFAVTLFGLVVLAAFGLGDDALFAEWLSKIARHATDPNSVNVGYATILDADFFHSIPQYVHVQSLLGEDAEARRERTLALALVVFAVLVPATAFVSRMPTDRALAFGYVYVYFLSPFAYYYALILLPFLLFFVADRRSRTAALGVASLLLSGSLGYLFFAGVQSLRRFPPFRGYHQEFGTYYYESWFLGLSVMIAIAVAGIAAYRAERREIAEIRAG